MKKALNVFFFSVLLFCHLSNKQNCEAAKSNVHEVKTEMNDFILVESVKRMSSCVDSVTSVMLIL